MLNLEDWLDMHESPKEIGGIVCYVRSHDVAVLVDQLRREKAEPVSVPQDEWTFDELDLRGSGDFMTTPPEGWESSDWRTCLELKAELHNKKVYRAEIKRLRALIVNQDSQPVTQDVEEFIAARSTNAADLYCDAVSVSDLRAWMAGHARVPGEATHAMKCEGEHVGEVTYEMAGIIYKAMLAASKESACNYSDCKCPIDKDRHCLKGLPNA